MYQKGFFFKENRNKVKKSFTFVDDYELFSGKRGYGFITKDLMEDEMLLTIPALNSGFRPVDYTEPRPIPTMFKVKVDHQGNYQVEIEAENDGSEAQIFLERRRLYYVGNFTGVKKFIYTANVCDIIPEGKERIYSDTDLDVSWIGEGLRIYSISVKEVTVPTIFIAGDSTVTDQPADYPYSPGTSYSGWGQMLTAFLNEKVAVSNHSHSGLTTDSFRKEGHYSIILQYIKPGDFFFMQFGHNDQKLEELKEDTGYRDNILRYVDEIRAQGAFPVIITSLARNTWKDGEYKDYLEKYAKECIKIGKELNIPVLDLHGLSMEELKKNGLEENKKFFFPGDLTHTNDYGAYLMASFVVSEIERKSKETKIVAYKQLKGYLRKDIFNWEIEKEKLKLPTLRNGNVTTEDEPYELKLDRLEEILRRI